jgi:(E)-4-hydroxy-3-methylbut-2-enyl-diphosphate synthase
MMTERRKTKQVSVGGVPVGGDAPISVQSMCNTKTSDVRATVRQIEELEEAGCEIIRLAVDTEADARALADIRKQTRIPIVADIQERHDVAIEAIKRGADKLRINPGKLGSHEQVREVIRIAREKEIPIRIGVNAGSLGPEILKRYHNRVTAEGMVESALDLIRFFEDNQFDNIVVALKASSIERTIQAYELLAEKVPYPFHIGLTEAGTIVRGTVNSSIALGYLLYHGIGDTMRVSLTESPIKEVDVAWRILTALGIRQRRADVFGCPTCGRTEIDVMRLIRKVEAFASGIEIPLSIGVMGCRVNGPGEAIEADLCVTGGRRGRAAIFRKGKRHVQTVDEKCVLQALIEEIRKIENERSGNDCAC